MAGWTVKDIPSQEGRLAIVTGSTGGLGYETALALAAAGAEVVLAGRNPLKGAEAVTRIKTAHPGAKVTFEKLDLADLADISAFSARFAAAHPSLDLLVNNAGVMAPPKRLETSDGFELQFGTNHLGHFALTAHLLPLLRRGQKPRVVNVSSLAHRRGTIGFDDLQSKKNYSPWLAYGQSKLANLLFTFELQRHSDAAGWGLLCDAAHPGLARTELIANGPGATSLMARASNLLIMPLAGQSAAEGALPTLFAATSPKAVKGGYYGPGGFLETKGPPQAAQLSRAAKDRAAAARLWQLSEELTGVRFPAT